MGGGGDVGREGERGRERERERERGCGITPVSAWKSPAATLSSDTDQSDLDLTSPFRTESFPDKDFQPSPSFPTAEGNAINKHETGDGDHHRL